MFDNMPFIPTEDLADAICDLRSFKDFEDRSKERSRLLRMRISDLLAEAGRHGITIGSNTESDSTILTLKEARALALKASEKAGESINIDPLGDIGDHGEDAREMDSEAADFVNRPPHYNNCRAECIEIIEDHGWGQHYCLGNAMKYLWRCQDKGTMRQDLEKARWYIDRVLNGLDGGK